MYYGEFRGRGKRRDKMVFVFYLLPAAKLAQGRAGRYIKGLIL